VIGVAAGKRRDRHVGVHANHYRLDPFIFKETSFHCESRWEEAHIEICHQTRILSAAALESTTTQAAHTAAIVAIATFLIEKPDLSLTIFLSGFED
jgi:hypothetical protein